MSLPPLLASVVWVCESSLGLWKSSLACRYLINELFWALILPGVSWGDRDGEGEGLNGLTLTGRVGKDVVAVQCVLRFELWCRVSLKLGKHTRSVYKGCKPLLQM